MPLTGRDLEPAASPWVHAGTTVLGRHRVLRVLDERVISPRTGRQQQFEVVETADAAVVAARTEDGGLILVEQYRIPLRRAELELPGGILEEGEEPIAAALRELREETGFTASSARLLGEVTLNPSLLTTRIHVVACEGARRTHEPQQDEGEDIHVRVHTPSEVQALVTTGRLNNAVALAALTLLRGGG